MYSAKCTYVDSTRPTHPQHPAAAAAWWHPRRSQEEVKDDTGGRRVDSSISTCMKQAEDPQGAPLWPPEVKWTRLSEAQSTRGAVAAATASAAAAASK
jgi:hypothetical protein